jgi:hypothetical protein
VLHYVQTALPANILQEVLQYVKTALPANLLTAVRVLVEFVLLVITAPEVAASHVLLEKPLQGGLQLHLLPHVQTVLPANTLLQAAHA